MKRGKPLRRTEFRPNPHKVREWQRKLRDPAGLEGTSRGPSRPLRRSQGKPRPRVPDDVRRLVRARSGGRCIVCLFEGKPRAGKARHLHHVWPKGENPLSGWPELAAEADNLVGICEEHHAAHEFSPRWSIPRECLPACVFALYERLDERARAYFDRTYRPTGPDAAPNAAK